VTSDLNGNGSATGLTIREIVLELREDVKEMLPQVQALTNAKVLDRLDAIERADLVVTVARRERGRIGSLTVGTATKLILVGQFVLGVWVAHATHLIP